MKTLGNVVKSASDNRTYKAIELPNKLVALIISDPEAEKSSAALSVEVGSLQDPVDAQGLAHYLEHMLFMGTTKYPNENEYRYALRHSANSWPRIREAPMPTRVRTRPTTSLRCRA